MKVAVIGAGEWGTVFGGVLRGGGHEVEILGRERDDGVVENAELVVVAVPSRSSARSSRISPEPPRS